MDFDIRPFSSEVLQSILQSWLLLIGGLTGVGLVIALLLSFARNGAAGGRSFVSGLASFLDDIISLSPRRILAVTRLTLKEAIRRKALLIFVVFAILLMFAGWFLADANERADLQVNVHVTFVLTSIAWLILPAVIFLSCWALPEDIRIRSLHTVVTKPARRLEIVAGRMFGMALVALMVLSVMGAVGYVWLLRLIPDSSRDQLTCRVPMFGYLYFVDANGQTSTKGLNVGDIWAFRSHITGNTRSRAVYRFENVDDSAVVSEVPTLEDGTQGDPITGLKLECRFEAFRTVKGTEASVTKGIQAQYTISQNPREEAFGSIAQSATLNPFADALRDAQFRNASTLLKDLTNKVRTSPDELQPPDWVALGYGILSAGTILEDRNDPRLADVPAKMKEAGLLGANVIEVLKTNSDTGATNPPPYEPFVTALEAVADALAANADALHEALPRLDVPMPAFHIAEYHEGDVQNIQYIPRTLRFAADYETLARVLSSLFEEWNAAGKLAEGNALKPDLVNAFVDEAAISAGNADLLVTVLNEQIAAGALTVADGKLAVADGRRWFHYFDSLIRQELLASPEEEGWVIEKDLIRDLTTNGVLRVEVACLDDQMYLGMARPDLFIRKPDRAFLIGYSKALLNIALMLMLIIVLGVTVSCIVKGPVALFFTLTFFIVGQFFHDFMLRKLAGAEQGLGTFESAILIAQHRNPQVGMDVNEMTQKVVAGADKGLEGILWVFSQIVPDFSIFNSGAAFVENGFDVPFNEAVLPAILIFLGFLIPCLLIAGALLKFRELEAK